MQFKLGNFKELKYKQGEIGGKKKEKSGKDKLIDGGKRI